MPFAAVPSVKLGVTVRPPVTALSSVTVKVIASPSSAAASAIVTAAPSSSRIVPVAISVVFTDVLEAVKPTVNVSSGSRWESSVVATVKVCVSPCVPAKVSTAVFSV